MIMLPVDNRATTMWLSRSSWLTVILFIIPITLTGVYAYAQEAKQIEINTQNDVILNEKIDAVRKEIKDDFKNLRTELTDIVNKQETFRRDDMNKIQDLIRGLN